MFANKQKNTRSRREPISEESHVIAFLGDGSEFEGRMVFNKSMRIDGAFRGEISSEDLLVVGDTAKLQGDVVVGSLIISGSFHGYIKAKTRVELRAPAIVNGDIEAPAISIEDGVIFNGTITMKSCREIKAPAVALPLAS